MNTIHNIKIILYILYTSCCSFILLVLQHISCVSSAYSDTLSSFQCVHCSLCTVHMQQVACSVQHAVFMQCCTAWSVAQLTASGHKSPYLWDLLALPQSPYPRSLSTLSLCPFPIFTYLLTSTLCVTQIVTQGP